MSAAEVQRVAVRMFYDPQWAHAVYREPTVALTGLDLSDDEKKWLTQPDFRRWSADGHCSHRALQSLIEEFSVSAALWMQSRSLHDLHTFFQSDLFHRAIMADESLATSFADWLRLSFHDIWPIVSLEKEMAQLRRRLKKRPRGSTGDWVLAPRIGTVIVPTKTIEVYASAARKISQSAPTPVDFILHGQSIRFTPHSFGPQNEAVIVECVPDTGHMQLSCADESLGILLEAFRQPKGPAELDSLAEKLAINQAELPQILRDLCDEGLIHQFF